MKILALVTARGGSKGFPGKNLALLGGRPLVSWSHAVLDSFRRNHLDTRLWLSTDSEEIRAAWPEADRPHRLRPAELAGDSSSSMAVVEYELAQAALEGFIPEAVLLLQPTSPLVALEDLEAAVERIKAGESSVIGVTALDHPIQWAYIRRTDGILDPILPPDEATRRQDLPEAVRPVGFYLCTTAFLRAQGRFLQPGLSNSVLVPGNRGVDIDQASDLAMAAHHVTARVPSILQLGNRIIGKGHPCFLIAEGGVNHNGDLDRALEMVKVAADAGADAIKFQTFRSEALASRFAPKAEYQAHNTGDNRSQLEMLKELELSPEAFHRIKEACDQAGILFLSTPFEEESAHVLDRLGVAAFKIGSGDLTNLPLLETLAQMGRPLILSTGMGTFEEVVDAVESIRKAGTAPLALLHCLSMYPAPCAEYNLRAMAAMEATFDVPIGLSDHTLGWEITLAAVALGATIIEKHFTLDRDLPGPDHRASLEPGELAEMIAQLRRVESALGDGIKRPMPSEMNTRAVARKSLVAVHPLPSGHVITLEDLAIKRPGEGISPARLRELPGRKLARGVQEDEALKWEDLQPPPAGGAQ